MARETYFDAFDSVPAEIMFIKLKLPGEIKQYEEISSLISEINFDDISEIRKQDYLSFILQSSLNIQRILILLMTCLCKVIYTLKSPENI